MSKRDKTSEKLLNSIRKTKEFTHVEADSTTPANAAPSAGTPAQTGNDDGNKDKEPVVQRIFSSRRVWPD